MAAIVKTNQRVYAAHHLHADLSGAEAHTHSAYMALGRGSTEWANESSPTVPVDSIDAEVDFWSNMGGLKKISTGDVALVVPRIDWTSGNSYTVFDDSSSAGYGESFYVMNSARYVYKCTVAGGGASTVEPIGHNNGSPIVNGDGYTWEFLYDIISNDYENIATTNWMPVYANDQVTNNSLYQVTYGDVDAYKTLGAKYLLVKCEFASTDIATVTAYRQVAVLIDPIDSGASPLTASTALKADMETTLSAGILMQLQNRTVIARGDSDSATIYSVIEL